ncbi:MAG: hypothetical protein HOV79_26525 [Hamadaea sp.]|nr:hypothetical protein [Hamadaea sp.]
MDKAAPDGASRVVSLEQIERTPLERIEAEQVAAVVDRIMGAGGGTVVVSASFSSSI